MTSSLRIATVLVAVSIASADGVFGIVLINLSKISQVRNSAEHESKNSYGTSVSDEAKYESWVHSQNILAPARGTSESDTLLWVGHGMVGLALASALCLLFFAFLDDVWHMGKERDIVIKFPGLGGQPSVQPLGDAKTPNGPTKGLKGALTHTYVVGFDGHE